MERLAEQWAFDLRRLLRAVIVLSINFILAALMISSIWLMEKLIQYLWQTGEPRLFGELPLTYIFHTVDVAILVMFAFNGIVEVFRSFRRSGALPPKRAILREE